MTAGADKGVDEGAGVLSGIGRRRWWRALIRVRTSLIAITLVTTAMLLWLIISFWVDAYVQRRDAVRVLEASEIEAELWHAAKALARESIATQILLHDPERADGGDVARIARLRGEAEVAVIGVLGNRSLAGLARAEAAVADWAVSLAALGDLRDRVVASLGLAGPDRAAGMRAAWWRVSGEVLDRLVVLNNAVRYRALGSTRSIEVHGDVAHALFRMHSAAERERSVVAGLIASGEALAIGHMNALARETGRFDQAFETVEGYAAGGFLDDRMRVAVDLVRERYRTDYDELRTAVLEAGTAGQPYPVRIAPWIAQTDSAIASISHLAELTTTRLTALAGDRAAHGLRRLVIDSAVVLIALLCAAAASWIVLVRIVRPLEAITVVMWDLASGRAAAAVPGTDRDGEIGEMARAVEVFKRTSDARAAEISQMNQRLQLLNDTLEDRVAERTREAEAARDEAIEANRAKSSFLANMSHELRTPLNAIIGYSEILAEDARDRGDHDLLPDLERIRDSGRHLLSLIAGVLDLSKIEAGRMDLHYEPLDVAALVSEVAAAVRPIAEQGRNVLEAICADGVGLIDGDHVKVRQILLNLMSNACKFTSGGRISLTASRVDDDGHVMFEVADTGVGIAPAKLERIFDAFTQADASTTRRFGGTGLGLAITRSFCDLLGGTIDVRSTEGRGTTFTVTLPVERPDESERRSSLPPMPRVANGEHRAAGRDAIEESGGDRRTVLVIDDDPVVRELLRRHLQKRAYSVLTADNGKAGIAAAAAARPDVITLDILMPYMDGWTVLGELKATDATKDIPVVVVSMLEDRTKAFSLGAADYLQKPVDRDKVIDVLSRHCGDSRPRRLLVLEDDLIAAKVLRRLLRDTPWEVTVAPNGAVGLDRMAEARPDAILLDLIMPEMDGFEFLARIRDNPDWADVPVIVLTAKDLTDDDRAFLDGRVQSLIAKGQPPETIIESLESVVERDAA